MARLRLLGCVCLYKGLRVISYIIGLFIYSVWDPLADLNLKWVRIRRLVLHILSIIFGL